MASKNKNRKPLGTTLGKASSSNGKDETIDLSHLRKPIETSIFGLTQVLTLFETATDEVRHYVAHECEILYECRICRTLFRSLANFILHKRSYCRERYRPARNTKEGTIINHMPESNVENPKESKKGVNSILDRLVEEQKNQQLTQSFLLDDCTTKSNSSVSTNEENEIALSIAKIDTSQSAVFQTMVNQSSDSDSLKSEVMEIHSIFENNEAIVGPDGKARVPPNKNAEWHLKCTVCGLKFSTKKTLAYHVKYKHNGAQFIYPCPICKETMANAWSVFRHLFKIHRKTAQQVRKMRDLVHSSAIRKSHAEILSKKNLDLALDKLRQGNQQWMNDFECDSDLKMCGGCGKRFERKAALHSHLQVCLKRSVAIKEDNAKRTQSDDKQAACLFRDPMKPVGSVRRKPAIVLRRSRQVAVTRRYSDDQGDCKGFGPSEVIESCRIRESCRQASPIARITEKRREVKEQTPKPTEIITIDDIDLKSTDDKPRTTNGESATNVPIDNITLIIKKDKYGDTKVIRKEKIIGATNRNKGKLIHKIKSSIRKQRITKAGITRKSPVKNISNNNSLPAVVQDKNSTRQEGNDDPGEVNASLVTKDAYTYEDMNNFDTKSDVIIIGDSYTKSEDSLRSEDTNRTDSNKSLLTIDNSSTNELNYESSLNDKNITLRNLLDRTPATGNRCLRLKVKRLADIISTDADNFPSCSSSLDLSLVPLFPDIVIEDECEHQQGDTKLYITANDEGGDAKPSTTPSLKRKHFNSKLRNFGRKAVKLAKEYKMFIKMAKNHINLNRNECTRCKLRYPTVDLLMQHMALHFHWLRYQCGMCNIMFFEKGDCRSHVAQSHGELESHEIDDTVVALARSKMKSLWTGFQELDYVDEENLNMQEDASREEHVIVGDTGNNCHYPSPFARPDGFGKPNIQDPQVRDMVMEVIFGITKEEPKDTSSSPESGSSEQLDSNLLENNRPMRSHVKPIQKDFVYEYNFVTKGYGHNIKKQGSTNSDDSKEALLESVPNTLENIDNLLNEGAARLHLKSKPLKVYRKGKEAGAKGLADDLDEKAGKHTQIDDVSS